MPVEANAGQAQPRVWIESLQFSDQTTVSLGPSDIVIIVGPNNSGKSVALRDLLSKTREKGKPGTVIKELILRTHGSPEDLLAWLEQGGALADSAKPLDASLPTLIHMIRAEAARIFWKNSEKRGLSDLVSFFVAQLDAATRVGSSDGQQTRDFAKVRPTHPIHVMYLHEGVEDRICRYFRRAFGEDLAVERLGGEKTHLRAGRKPHPQPGEDRLSWTYLERFRQMPLLDDQGDGIRSFVGVVLHTLVLPKTIVVIDEPEAFLHPPQARLLGQMLAKERDPQCQLFLATHSGDLIRGVLDTGSGNVRVIRICRNAGINPTRELSNQDLRRLWDDPILRYSNILDGVFHEKVVVCESDADCRFYAAVLDAIYEARPDERKPDIMFTHAGGKDRVPTVARALKALDVPVVAVMDFDALRDARKLQETCEVLGVQWEQCEGKCRAVRNALESKKPELGTEEVKRAIKKVLDSVTDTCFPEAAGERIRKVLRDSSPWELAKQAGRAFVPSGDPMRSCKELLETMADGGLFIVPVGEVERFDPAHGGHGPAWVNKVLENRKNLATAPELREARDFVIRLARAKSAEQQTGEEPANSGEA